LAEKQLEAVLQLSKMRCNGRHAAIGTWMGDLSRDKWHDAAMTAVEQIAQTADN